MASNFSCNSSISQANLQKVFTSYTTKKYACSFPGCDKKFRYKSGMDRHLVVHSRDRSYPCPFPDCEKSFKRFDTLSDHIRIHNNLTFSCPMEGCESKLTTRSALKYHLLKCHSEGLNYEEINYKRTLENSSKSKTNEKDLLSHKKVGCSAEIQHYKFEELENWPILNENHPQVKEEALGSETHYASHDSESTFDDEICKFFHSEANPLQISNGYNTISDFDEFNIKSLFDEETQVKTQKNTFMPDIDSKLKEIIGALIEENKNLKESLESKMKALRDVHLSFNNIQEDNEFYGFQSDDLLIQNFSDLPHSLLI